MGGNHVIEKGCVAYQHEVLSHGFKRGIAESFL